MLVNTSANTIQRPISLIPNDGEFLPARDFGYLNFLAVGGVSFVVVGSRYRNQVELAATGPLSGAVRAVWPIVEQRVTWPPELMLDQALIDALMLPPGCFDVRVFPG